MKKTDLEKMRHSCEHVLTQAMLRLYPKIKMAMGPATEEGFYFDFDPSTSSGQVHKISETDFPKIEKEMAKIIKADLPIRREELSVKEARKLFVGNEYKQEWLDEIEQRGEKATMYWTGPSTSSGFVDLCAGPHVPSTSKIGPFKLLSIAGAYWRGDEKNKMLTRIYGTCFPTKKELDHYLWQLEEAKKRDHRKLGKELEIFTFDDRVGQGLPLWLPKGTIIREELEKWAKETEKEWGYQRVATPHITKEELYKISGHLPYYAEDMYSPLDIEGEKYYLKPMNCPHHHMIYQSRIRSYKDLPLRLAEYGQVYRFERSGNLFGLFRVRGFCQNDAHIYVQEDKAIDEFVSVMKMHQYYYQKLNIKGFKVKLGLRDPQNLRKKYHGDEEMWQKAEKMTRQALEKVGVPYTEDIGGAVHYGPKGDIIIESVIGKEYAIGTCQIDLFMPKKFNLTYVDKDGKEKFVVVIHRAPLGSHERFIGFLLEHYAGAFPTWLSPVQVEIIPISERHLDYSKQVHRLLLESNVRAELDERNQTMEKKIREATLQKIPYMVIIGDKEIEKTRSEIATPAKRDSKKKKEKIISVRTRKGENLGQIALTKFLNRILEEIRSKSFTA